MLRSLTAFIIFVTTPLTTAQDAAPTLKQIMDDPSWFARSPELVGWLPDSSGFLWDQRRDGVIGRDTTDRIAQALDGLNPSGFPTMLEEVQRPFMLPASGTIARDGSAMLTTHAGDVFMLAVGQPNWVQLTRTEAREWSPIFLDTPDRIAYRAGSGWVIRDLRTGLASDAADIRFAKDPAKEEDKKKGDLEQQQHDLFLVIREREKRRELNEQTDRSREQNDPTRVPGPFYLDESKREAGQWLSPNARFLLVAMQPSARPNDRRDVMPSYVTDDGYVSTSAVRPKVGYETEQPVSFMLLDLAMEKATGLPLDSLPMIADDPLVEIKAAVKAREKGENKADTEREHGESSDLDASDDTKKPNTKPRPVGSVGVRWSDSGRTAAVMLRSHDNKDRWILTVDTSAEAPAFTTVHHQRDPAWINWDFNEFGFVPGTESVWFLSEHTGFGHLYVAEPDAEPRALTEGDFEVRSVDPARDGKSFIVRTNRTDPGVYELERVSIDGQSVALTAMGGTVESFRVSPDETRAVITWSDAMNPPELFAVALDRPRPTVRLTATTTQAFRRTAFTAPQFIDVPSSHADRPIRTRVYRPDPERFPGPRPIVIFSHGAGYLQWAHNGWSNYFREHMFHTLLTERGILVVGPDFRASEGYGRDWRTAIYRRMGYPELEDFDDCIAYAAEHFDGDPERVGIYGGSYGGFMTLMAMFLRPDVYDAGAALRSVTDWRHYNHGYTSNILDTPQIDPEPFDRCSPINFAEHLQGRLLMCHGMLDDNVVAQDIIRLTQHLIELEKHDWELALYPVEPHGFREPSSWYDEYRRIYELFEDELLAPSP